MATKKKPAKPIAGQSRIAPTLDPSIYGALIKFHGSKSAQCTCGTCAKKIVSGMVREKGGAFYCSSVCAKNSN